MSNGILCYRLICVSCVICLTATPFLLSLLMHSSICPLAVPPPPRHIPEDLQIFSFLVVYSPPPGTQRETIPHPELLIQGLHSLEKSLNSRGRP